MKKIMITAILTLSLAVSVFAKNPNVSVSKNIDWNKVEKNYLVALSSENIGLRHSATNFLAEYRLNGAVHSLITVLQKDKVERLRMAAALALVQIGNKEGVQAVKDAMVYDGSEKVVKFCEQLMNSSSQEISLK